MPSHYDHLLSVNCEVIPVEKLAQGIENSTLKRPALCLN